MTRKLTPSEQQKLKSRALSKVFWWAALLDDLKSDDVETYLLRACHSSEAIECGATNRLAELIVAHLATHYPHHLSLTYFDAHNAFRQHEVGMGDKSVFSACLASVIRRSATKHQLQVAVSLSRDGQWAREFLSGAVAKAVALHLGATHTGEVVYAEYPFLAAQVDLFSARLFGQTRHAINFAKASTLLCEPRYADTLSEAISDVILDAPEGRHKHWAVAASTVYRKTHPIDVAEKLGFSPDAAGHGRAKVLMTRVGRRVHDRFFLLLCHKRLMTAALAEYMAIEFRMPAEVVRASLAVMHLRNSHAIFYTPTISVEARSIPIK